MFLTFSFKMSAGAVMPSGSLAEGFRNAVSRLERHLPAINLHLHKRQKKKTVGAWVD